jgi:hypothetical protein
MMRRLSSYNSCSGHAVLSADMNGCLLSWEEQERTGANGLSPPPVIAHEGWRAKDYLCGNEIVVRK